MSGGVDANARDAVDEDHFWRLVEVSGDAVYSLDADGRFTYANDAHAALTGYPTERLLGEHVSTVTDERDLERSERVIRELLRDRDRRSAVLEMELVTREGERIPTEVHLSLLLDDDGEFIGSTGIVRDVRHRAARERELLEYRAIVDTVPDGVLVIDEEGIIDDANRTAAWLFGCDREDLVGRPFTEFVGEDDDAASLEDRYLDLLGTLFIAEAIGEQARFEYEVTVEGDHRVFETNLALRPSTDEEFRGTIGVVRDITERRERERVLERYESIVEASGDPMYALDEAGRYTFVNRAHTEVVGYEPSELLGTHVSIIADEDDVRRGEAMIRELLGGDDRRHGTFEVTLLTKGGERIPAEVHLALLTDEEGEFRGTAGVMRDISSRKARARALERQKDRLNRVASVLSHDLRNPLNVAMGTVQLAREDGTVEPLAEAVAALDRMGDLIDDVLSLARQGQQVVEPDPVSVVRIVDLATATVDLDAERVETDDALGTIFADASRLQQLLENLFRNAVDHGGPEVHVRVGSLPEGFFVEDDGPGISPGDREAVFEFGHTTSESGTGYGLAIVKEIAEAHGWTVAATAGRDGGARFEVTGVESAPST